MRTLSFPLLTLAAGLASCESPAARTTASSSARPASQEQAAGASGLSSPAGEAPKDSPDDNRPAQVPPPAKDGQYRLLGVKDPDMGNVVAFALKVPRDWPARQSFTREWTGATPSVKVYLSFRSPDGSQQIEYLPAVSYGYAEGPGGDQLRAQARSFGMESQLGNTNVPPMPALTYIREYLLPQLAQKGLHLRSPGNERSTPPRLNKGQQESSASVDGTLPNGRKVRVEARMFQSAMPSGGDTFHTWSVIPSITQTSGDLDATYAHTRIAQESIVSNPAWQRQNNELINQGIQANTAASQRAYQGRMEDIRRAGEANTARHNERMAASDQQMASYNERMASQDRQHERYVDNAINGETKYENPATGQRVKVANGYNHVYTDNKGQYYGSNTPIKASEVNWQELAEVPADKY